MSEKNYDQNFFKMYCPGCDQKLVIENSAPGDKFKCPGCELEISTPEFSQEMSKVEKPTLDPISLLTEKKLQSTGALKQKEQKKSKSSGFKKSPKKVALKPKAKVPRKKRQKRFPVEYLLVPALIYLFIQTPALLEKYGFFQKEEIVKAVKVEKPKTKPKMKKEIVKQEIVSNEIIYEEEKEEGLKPIIIPEKQKLEDGNTLSSLQIKKLIGHLKSHCYECHGNKRHEEELNFESMSSSTDFFNNYINFKMSLKYLESSEMPPPEDGTIPEKERLEFIDLVGRLLYTIESKSEGKTGPSKIRRLSAVAYDNTIKTVTGLNLKLSRTHQIDNTDDISTVSMEKFLSAAQEVASYARFDINKGFVFIEKYQESRKPAGLQKELEMSQREILKEYYFSDFSYSEALRRSMTAVNQFNASKEKSEQLISKLANRHKIHKDFLLKSLKFFNGRNFALLTREGLKDWMLLKQEKYDSKKARSAIKKFISHYEKTLVEEVKVNSIRERLISQFKDKIQGLFKFSQQELQQRISDQLQQDYLRISSLQDLLKNGDKSRYRSFFAEKFSPDVHKLMSSLFRRPASEGEVNQFLLRFMKFMPQYGLDNSVRMMMTNIFSNLKFIFRFEQKKGVEAKVDGFELANRLSYFIWNSPPDEELIQLAESGELFMKENLLPQIQRMLQDDRAAFFAEEFANSWLGISAIKNLEMEDNLNLDMYEETVRFFDYVIRNEVKVTDLISSNYSFMNAKLLSHYGIENRSVFKFEKVENLEKTRGGLLGQAAILAMTSVEGRTNPILRGNFVLNTILGTPTPPPPADAPPLPEQDKIEGRSLKQVLVEHRRNPACKGCHAKIDPLGFPLENYDEHGRWRDMQDTVGELATGKTINGPIELKKYLMKNKDAILKNLSANVFAHALGRGLYYYDYYVVNQCLTNLKANDYRFSAIIATIVLSHQFQHKF